MKPGDFFNWKEADPDLWMPHGLFIDKTEKGVYWLDCFGTLCSDTMPFEKFEEITEVVSPPETGTWLRRYLWQRSD